MQRVASCRHRSRCGCFHRHIGDLMHVIDVDPWHHNCFLRFRFALQVGQIVQSFQLHFMSRQLRHDMLGRRVVRFAQCRADGGRDSVTFRPCLPIVVRTTGIGPRAPPTVLVICLAVVQSYNRGEHVVPQADISPWCSTGETVRRRQLRYACSGAPTGHRQRTGLQVR